MTHEHFTETFSKHHLCKLEKCQNQLSKNGEDGALDFPGLFSRMIVLVQEQSHLRLPSGSFKSWLLSSTWEIPWGEQWEDEEGVGKSPDSEYKNACMFARD